MRNFLKSIYFRSLDWSFYNRFSRFRLGGSITILTYHSIVSDDAPIHRFEYRNCVTQSNFSRQLDFLKKHFKVISLNQAVNRLNEADLQENYAVVTFDDGYRNNFTHALPTLNQYRLPAAFFLTTGLIDSDDCLWTDWITYLLLNQTAKSIRLELPQKNFYFKLSDRESRIGASIVLRKFLKKSTVEISQQVMEQLKKQAGKLISPVQADPERYAFLTWKEAQTMVNQKMEIGAHTHNHVLLSMISDDQVHFELAKSKEIIEQKLRQKCTYFSYPNGAAGDFNENHFAVLRTLGYRAAVTQMPGINKTGANAFALKRINISSQMTLPVFKAYVSGTYHKK